MTQTVRGFAVKVDGLKELSNALKAEPERIDKELRASLKDMAKGVSDDARSKASSLGKPRPGARVVSSIRPSSSNADSRVSLGGTDVPWAMGAEFGSKRFKQFRPWSGSGEDAGYFLFPAIRHAKSEILPAALDEIIEGFRGRLAEATPG